MKKILLLAIAGIMTVTANAQLTQKSAADKAVMQNKTIPMETSKVISKGMASEQQAKLVQRNRQMKQLNLTAAQKSSFMPVRKAAQVQNSYEAVGTDHFENVSVEWEMFKANLQDGTPVLVDVVPDEDFGADGVPVTYEVSGNQIIIDPQLVASSEKQSMYIFITTTTTDEVILDIDDNGNITGKYKIGYAVFSTPTYDPTWATCLGWYDLYDNVKYSLPGAEPVAPEATIESSTNILFSTVGKSGYNFSSNLGIMPVNAPVTVKNTTTDQCTAYNWSASVLGADDSEDVITSASKDFTFAPVANSTYTDINLVAENSGKVSDPVVLGAGIACENAYFYGGGIPLSFSDIDDTPVASFFDMNNDLAYYSNLGTPDVSSTVMTKLYAYQGKPSAPLYIENIKMPVGKFTAKDDFTLHAKIVKCDYTGGRISIGDVIAEGDASVETIEQGDFISNIVFPLYVVDEDGMNSEIDHLFIEDEFAIIVEGWDNGTFSALFGVYSQDNMNAYANNAGAFWFEKPGEEGSMYSYTSWKTACLIGYGEATYGYLATEDDTNITLSAEGGEATIHVEPMLCSVNESGEQTTRLFVDGEMPEWLTIEIANEDYANDYVFDLKVSAEASSEDREATVRLYQEGAYIDVTVKQGAAAGINSVTTNVVKGGKMYDLNGKEVGKNFKGIAVSKGGKFLVK